MFHCRRNLAHLARYRPEEFFDLGACLQVEQAEAEAVKRLFAYLQGIVPALEKADMVEVVPYLVKFARQFVSVGFDFLVVFPDGQLRRFKYVYDQDRMVCRQRSAAFGDDVGLTESVFGAGVDDGRHGVVGILLNRIVHRTFRRRAARTVIVHSQTAAYVDEVYVEAESRQLDVELRGFAKSVLYNPDLVDLTAYVEMDKFQAVFHFAAFEDVDGFEQFRTVKTEFRRVAAAFAPFARACARKFDAYAYVGPYLQLARYIGYKAQFVELFHHQIDAASHLLGQKSKFDIGGILVTVADYQGIGVDVGGEHRMEFGL